MHVHCTVGDTVAEESPCHWDELSILTSSELKGIETLNSALCYIVVLQILTNTLNWVRC